ncbi:hypothetical protein CGRA01v4_02696 [Colletotrichum graminicola]|nr:hypothetical protein CGRA01v4_02696 [Colletotrichum graminicola]
MTLVGNGLGNLGRRLPQSGTGNSLVDRGLTSRGLLGLCGPKEYIRPERTAHLPINVFYPRSVYAYISTPLKSLSRSYTRDHHLSFQPLRFFSQPTTCPLPRLPSSRPPWRSPSTTASSPSSPPPSPSPR